MFSSWFYKIEFRCRTLDTLEPVDSRQNSIEGWDQEKLKASHILMVGAGGLNSWTSLAMVQKGIGKMSFCDPDPVSPSNCNRQFYRKKNLYKPKGIEICKNLSEVGSMGTVLKGYPCWFQDLPEEVLEDSDVWIIGIDNQIDGTRKLVCQKAFELEKPSIFLGVSRDADYGYVFVQEPGECCWNCVFGGLESHEEKKCPGVPASVDILVALAGHATYAVDTILMNRKRCWNYRTISLAHNHLVNSVMVERENDCEVCCESGSL